MSEPIDYTPPELPTHMQTHLQTLGLTPPVWDAELTADDIQYFLDHFPFLQIVDGNPDGKEETYSTPQQVTASSNWTILNYGPAISSSPGKFLWGGGDFRVNPQDDDDDGGGVVNPGKGTVWRQAFDTAADMVTLAKENGWDCIEIVDGHPIMQWAAWSHALDEGIQIVGYEPDQKAIERRERVKRALIDALGRLKRPNI